MILALLLGILLILIVFGGKIYDRLAKKITEHEMKEKEAQIEMLRHALEVEKKANSEQMKRIYDLQIELGKKESEQNESEETVHGNGHNQRL